MYTWWVARILVYNYYDWTIDFWIKGFLGAEFQFFHIIILFHNMVLELRCFDL